MRPEEDNPSLDSERARLIGSIYEVVLRPEHFDSFMADWSDFVDNAARRLGALKVSDGASTRQLEDPVIEAHFRRAFSLFERMGRGETVVPGSEGRAPLMRLGRGGKVLASSPEAAEIFGEHAGLTEIRRQLDPDSVTRLNAFLAALERAPASGRFAVLSLAMAPVSLSDSLPGGGLLAIVTCRDPEGDHFVAELRTMGIGWTSALSSVLAQSFHLTPRETELVRELTRGGDLPAVSLRSGRSLNTLRAQLKSVFAKTRTSGQPELMRLIAALMLHGPETDGPVDLGAGAVPEATRDGAEEIAVDVGDGRIMPLLVLGPEDGVPVVFVHGMLEGHGALLHLGGALRAAGIRIIAPMRANFGNSYADPRIKESVDVFAKDLAIVLETLGVKRALIMGHMAGAVHAYAAAARLGETIAGIVNVSGAVPITSIEQFATMTPRQRAMAYTARFAPALLPAVLRAGIAQIDSSSAEAFMRPLYPQGTPDRDLVERPEVGRALIAGYRFTVAQGQRAFHADAWHVTRDWSALVAGSDCPVLLLHGAHDPVVSIRSVREFARDRNRVELREYPNEGQLVLYSKPQHVVNAIADFARATLLASA